MKLGTNDIGSVYLGTNAVQKVYLGNNEVWSSFTGLLDTYTGAAAAYSLRKLRSAYTGSAIRVRRTNLDEMDIGFDALGNLNTTALLAFTGTGALDNGFVKTWYDQSGNATDATQLSAANQPQIVSAGSVILDNSKPAVQFDGINDVLIYNGLVYTTNTLFSNVVFSLNSPNNFAAIASQNSGGTGRSSILSIDDSSPKKSVYFFNNGVTSGINKSSGTITNLTQTLMTNYSQSNNYFNALNGSSGNNDISGISFTPTSANGFGIGGQPNNFNFLTGKIQELNIWNSDQSANKTGIEDNINDFYSIY
jgi:hypothetical protein